MSDVWVWRKTQIHLKTPSAQLAFTSLQAINPACGRVYSLRGDSSPEAQQNAQEFQRTQSGAYIFKKQRWQLAGLLAGCGFNPRIPAQGGNRPIGADCGGKRGPVRMISRDRGGAATPFFWLAAFTRQQPDLVAWRNKAPWMLELLKTLPILASENLLVMPQPDFRRSVPDEFLRLLSRRENAMWTFNKMCFSPDGHQKLGS